MRALSRLQELLYCSAPAAEQKIKVVPKRRKTKYLIVFLHLVKLTTLNSTGQNRCLFMVLVTDRSGDGKHAMCNRVTGTEPIFLFEFDSASFSGEAL